MEAPPPHSLLVEPSATSIDIAISDLERKVMAVVAASEERTDPPGLCAVEVGSCCASDENNDLGFPNVDLALVLVSNLCFSHNTPFMWKLLDEAIARGLVYPLHVLALLTSRITKSVDDALQLSHIYCIEKVDFGLMVRPKLFNCFVQRVRFIKAKKSSTEILTSVDHFIEKLFSNVQEVISSVYRPHKRSLWGLMDDTRLVNSPLHSCIGYGKAELARMLQTINQATWHETLQALWMSALRIVQREIRPTGPVPELEARLCMLLSIIPLSIAILLKEESDTKGSEGNRVSSRKQGLVTCLQSLGQFSSLLSPPQPVIDAANAAATKSATFIKEIKIGSRDPNIMVSHNNSSTKAMGNLLHLIVEACIARGLIDTSAYLWPGYLIPCMTTELPNLVHLEDSPWSNFMKGAPLTRSLQSALIDIPAPSSLELKKLAHLAFNGSENERLAAVKILGGASLTRGWNIQVPQVAAALVRLCEGFGSFSHTSTFQCSTEEEASIYSVFSRAFLFLLRLYKFYRRPQMQNVSGRQGLVKPEITLEYLLHLYSTNCISNSFNTKDAVCSANVTKLLCELPCGLNYIDAFPKLCHWHFQNQACLSSIVSSLPNHGTVLSVANKILNMIFSKSIRGEQVVTINTSFGTAWEVLESMPYVLEPALTACSYGQLSPRELITGIKDLVDFFPASIAAVVSYLSAEITGGVWKNVPMNGTDWPNPSEALYTYESKVKAVLASVGVETRSCYPCDMPPMLPLPLAVLLSVTITSKLDVSGEYTRFIAGRALGNNALHCNWPGMLIIGALWIQKAPKWQEYLTVTSAGSPFTHDQNAVRQLVYSLIKFASILPDKWSCPGSTQLASGEISLATATLAARQSAILGASLLCVTGHALSVQVLFEETVPIFLISSDAKRYRAAGSISSILKGHVISYFMFFSSAIVSGFWDNSPSGKLGTSEGQPRIVASHLKFMAGVFEGEIVLGCDPVMWKTHVMCFLGLLVRFAPAWIPSVKLDVLKKVSIGLRSWHEYDLALSLLEFGGIGAFEAVVESLF
ncbi:hypothetical protein LUZ61_017634 [Rhynchospora tenuis]|uniref:Uncharacterized protein n=1 Tax=Rhynchospora tenuis TaxID=198213 RepID=A0AAD6EL65_9POAL|nr:hypothetical protein LUZ61_017634 [Rhynchospora tenuis]